MGNPPYDGNHGQYQQPQPDGYYQQPAYQEPPPHPQQYPAPPKKSKLPIIVAVVVVVVIILGVIGAMVINNPHRSPSSVVKAYFNGSRDMSELSAHTVLSDTKLISYDFKILQTTHLSNLPSEDRDQWNTEIERASNDYKVRIEDVCRVDYSVDIVYEELGVRIPETEYDEIYCVKIDGKWYIYSGMWW